MYPVLDIQDFVFKEYPFFASKHH